MVNDHLIDLVVADEVVLVCDRAIGACVAVQGVDACRPQVRAQHMQVLNLLCVARVELEKLLASFRHTLDLRSDRYKYGCLVLRPTDDDTGNIVRERLGRAVTRHELALLVLPVL